jgi:hypothetical protein
MDKAWNKLVCEKYLNFLQQKQIYLFEIWHSHSNEY